jgi:predicted transcriptional regulator of viral defense system
MTSPDPSELRFRDIAIRAGFSVDELGRLVRRGEWARLRRGAYLPGMPPEDRISRHRLLVHATVRGLRRPAVVSHQSAAVLLGLWNVPLGRVHITRPPRSSSDIGRLLRSHVARLGDDEIVTVAGLPVTNALRTVLDLARSLPFETGVVVVDAALHRGVIQHDAVRRRLLDLAGTPGSRAAARVVAFADARSESVGESRSRVILHAVGIRPPALQHPILSSSGVFVGRVDFAWEDEGVIGEFDGRIKYGRLLRPGQAPGDAVFEEKRREDAIREEGWGVVRWTWGDLQVSGRVPQRVRRALDRGGAARSRG